MNDQNYQFVTESLSVETDVDGNPRILAIGHLDTWREVCGKIPAHRNLHFSDLIDIDDGLIALMMPDLVVSPVVTARFDCLDVAERLANSGYRGAYRALALNLPNPGIVRREVRGCFPEIDFDICEIRTSELRPI